MKPQEGKLRAIEQFKQPKTQRQIWSFFGLSRYYYWFILNYVTIAVPSTNKTRKAEPVVIYTPECTKAFSKLRELLLTASMMMNLDFSCPSILQTDASEVKESKQCLVKQIQKDWITPWIVSAEYYCPGNKNMLPFKKVPGHKSQSLSISSLCTGKRIHNPNRSQGTPMAHKIQTVITDHCNGIWHNSYFDFKLCIAKDEIMQMLILFPDKLNRKMILGQT